MASPIPAFPLLHPPRCRRCGNPASPMNRHTCYGSRIRSNAGRPYYICPSSSSSAFGTGRYGAEGCGNFVTFDDVIGVTPTNPPCDCGWAARRGISRKGQVFYGCPVGACGFFSWGGDEDDEKEEVVQQERVVVKVVQKIEEVQRPQEVQLQKVQEVQEVQEVQRMPEVQAVQEVHQVHEDHHIHEVHQVHQKREDQEVQKVHQVPEAHEARKVHEVEEDNEVHDVQDVHELHEEEETTDNDEDYDEWGAYSHEGDDEDSETRSYRISQANSLRRFPTHEDNEKDETSRAVDDPVPVPAKQEVEDEKGPAHVEPESMPHAQKVTYELEPAKQEVEHVHQQLFVEANEDTPHEKAMVPALREVTEDVEWGVVGNEWPLVRTASPPRRRRRCCWFF